MKKRNLEQGFYDSKGQFHPVRKAADYDDRRVDKGKGFKGEVFARDRRTKQWHLIPLGRTTWTSKAEAIRAANAETARKGKRAQYRGFKAVELGREPNPMRKRVIKKIVKKRAIKRKANRVDIHRIVRDHIRAGRNQKQILALMKRAGFKKEHLAEARKIYNQEKNFVRRMMTGKNPKASKIVSTVKRVAVKVGKAAIGAVKGAVRGGAKAAKGNPRKRQIIYSGSNNRVEYDSKTGFYYHYQNGRLIGKTRTGDPGDLSKKKKAAKGNPRKKGSGKGKNPSYTVEARPKTESMKETVSALTRGSAIRKVQRRVKGPKNAYTYRVEKNPKRKVSTRKRRRNSPIAEQQRKEFAGHFDGYRDLYYPSTSVPKEPSKLGELKSIRTGKADFTPVKGAMWLVRDIKGHLHIGLTRDGQMYAGEAQDLGKVERIEYLERKPHLGDYQLTEYYHRMGEENGVKPHLWSDGKGGLVFRGGDYRIESRGIVN